MLMGPYNSLKTPYSAHNEKSLTLALPKMFILARKFMASKNNAGEHTFSGGNGADFFRPSANETTATPAFAPLFINPLRGVFRAAHWTLQKI